MTNRFRIKLEGGESLARQLRALGAAAEAILGAATEAGAELVREEADRLAPEPVIQQEIARQTRTRAQVDVGIAAVKWYLKFFETGARGHTIPGPLAFTGAEGEIVIGAADHPGMSERPFLRPAFDTKTAGGTGGMVANRIGEKIKATLP